MNEHHDHNHHHDHDHHAGQGIGAFFSNFNTYDAPLHVKLRLAWRNTMIKMRTHSDCCGHLGEPGC